MKNARLPTYAIIFLLVIIFWAASYSRYAQSPLFPNQASQQGFRGAYLVEEVARCWECHTPQASPGRWDANQWLAGAALWFEPIHPIPNWAYKAPGIAGLTSFSDNDARKILENGVAPNGSPLRLPMHSYHLSVEDAGAIIAYLRSGGPKQ
jgi:hypothetical protein